MDTTSEQPRNHSRIPGLDALRGIAILLVIFGHLLRPPMAPDASLGGRWRPEALGVSLFFVLSGYLITRLLLTRERIDIRAFYVARAYRILPAAYVFLAFAAFVVPARAVLACACFAGNISGTPAIVRHFWSLAIEEQFYFAWPTIMLIVPRRWLTPGCLAIIVLQPFWIHVSYFILQHGVSNEFRTDYRLDGIVTGCVLALAAHQRIFSLRTATALVLSGAATTAIATFVRIPHGSFLNEWLLNAGIGGLLLGAAHSGMAWLDAAPLRWIGRLSYSLYLWQQPWAFGEWHTLHAHWYFSLAPIFANGLLSHYLVERPMLRLRDRRVGRPSVILNKQESPSVES